MIPGMMNRNRWLGAAAGAVGAALAIGGMELFSAGAELPLMAIPFATSIVLVLGSPQAEPAQPRALIGGHLVSTAVGLAVIALLGPGPWAAALASAGGNRPAGGGGPWHVLGVPAGPGRRRCAVARAVRLCLAQPGLAWRGRRFGLAGALVVMSCAGDLAHVD
jgi:hypothetical protein